MWLFPLAAAGVSGTFCVTLARRYRQTKGPHLLAWALALSMFALASAAAAFGLAAGWSSTEYRVYYLFGAILNVPVLALGTIYLLGTRRVAAICALVIMVAGAFAAVAVLRADISQSALSGNQIPAGSDAMPEGIRNLSRYYSFTGFAVVVAGALWSAWRLARSGDRRLQRLARANLLIATGTFIVALASGFARYGQGTVFAAGLAVGVTVMFVGFTTTRVRSA